VRVLPPLFLLSILAGAPALGAPRERAVLVALDTELLAGEQANAGQFRPAAKDAPVGQFRFVRAAGELVEIATYAETPDPERCAEPVVLHPALELHFFVPAKALVSTVSAPEKATYKDGSAVTVYPGAAFAASETPPLKGRTAYRLRQKDLVEDVMVRPKSVTTVFTPKRLPQAKGALAGPQTLAVAGGSVELHDDQVLPLVGDNRRGGKMRVTVRGRCVVIETGVKMLMLGGMAGRGTGAEGIPRNAVSAGTKLFFETGAPAGEVMKDAEPTTSLPDGRRCFEVAAQISAEHEPAKLRVCTAR
jgi:hypothetical protein